LSTEFRTPTERLTPLGERRRQVDHPEEPGVVPGERILLGADQVTRPVQRLLDYIQDRDVRDRMPPTFRRGRLALPQFVQRRNPAARVNRQLSRHRQTLR
jgi:hypothetical protein